MAKVAYSGTGDFDAIVKLIVNETTRHGLTCELKDSSTVTVGEYPAIMLVFEKYYMRNKSRASLSVLVTGGDSIHVSAISSGGGVGILLNFTWGAESDFVNIIASLMESNGFHSIY